MCGPNLVLIEPQATTCIGSEGYIHTLLDFTHLRHLPKCDDTPTLSRYTLNVCEPTALHKIGPILYIILYKLMNFSGHYMA